MTDAASNPAHVRAALFVDFDNIYLGLQNEDPRAAELFATHPGRWLRWLQEGLPTDSHQPRKILSRRCYLNPSQFSRFRPYFIRSAFEVVDCPPLTRGGKTSADIQMVMDIMDALGHVTRFEEFIILSGDADFTPVLLRLSRHDRRSVVLAAGPASAAYKAACDLLIDQDTFLEEAIGISEGSPVRPGTDSELLQRIAARVHERSLGNGDLVATDLPSIFREFPEFTPDSNWLGFYSLRGMTNAVVQARVDLEMIEGDPWRVRIRTDAPDDPDRGIAGPDDGSGDNGGTAGGAGSAGDNAAWTADGQGAPGLEALATRGGAATGDDEADGSQAAAVGAAGGGRGDDAAASGASNGGAAGGGRAAGGGIGAAGLAASAGTAEAGIGNVGTAAPLQLLRAIADKVHARTSAAGELLATDLPAVYREFPQFTPTSNWLGFYSLRGLSDAVIRARGDLQMVDGDPWRVRLRAPRAESGDPPAPGGGLRAAASRRSTGTYGASGTGLAAAAARWAAALPAAGAGEGADDEGAWGGAAEGATSASLASPPSPASAAPPPAAEEDERLRQIDAAIDFVRTLVSGSDSPIPTARAAQAVIGRFGDSVLASRWYGTGSFRDLLASAGDVGFAVSATRPGYLYDPDLHQTPLGQAEDPESGDPEMTSLAHRIHRITDTPYLTPAEYALVFREIAEEVKAEGYFLTRTSKAVRDRCIEEGTPIARTSVNFILRGITSAGHQFDPAKGNDPGELADAFLKNVVGLCESAGMPLSDEEREQLAAWIVGEAVKAHE